MTRSNPWLFGAWLVFCFCGALLFGLTACEPKDYSTPETTPPQTVVLP